jgi:hypothetical protein
LNPHYDVYVSDEILVAAPNGIPVITKELQVQLFTLLRGLSTLFSLYFKQTPMNHGLKI